MLEGLGGAAALLLGRSDGGSKGGIVAHLLAQGAQTENRRMQLGANVVSGGARVHYQPIIRPNGRMGGRISPPLPRSQQLPYVAGLGIWASIP